ncbi:hypothetical protein COOONC_11943 [Cooperia oncophora]
MTENDDVQLEKAHERIRELNSELVRQGDASAEAVLSRAIAMLDKISLSTTLLNDSKTESARLAKDLRQFVTSLQAAVSFQSSEKRITLLVLGIHQGKYQGYILYRGWNPGYM